VVEIKCPLCGFSFIDSGNFDKDNCPICDTYLKEILYKVKRRLWFGLEY